MAESIDETRGAQEAPAIAWDGLRHSYRAQADWMDRVSPDLPLHDEADDDLDPVTFEVIRNRLWTINIAHGEALTRISGSPTFQALDFNMCILTETGEIAMNAPFLQYLASGAPMAIRYIMENYSGDPGIHEGDAFLGNDPWVGAAHQMDVLIAQPVFVDGELFAWVANAGHQYDLGGLVPGGWPQNAVDVFSDPVLFSPFKLVERGTMRRDLETMYRRQSRMPDLTALDLRAQLAGCRFAAEQIQEACATFGAPAVKGAMRRILDNAQRAFAQKLERIPDGTWSEVRYFDEKLPGDRTTHRMQVNVTKTGDRIRVTNEGTEAQDQGPNGFVFTGFAGSVMGVIAVTMLTEQTFSLGGAERQIDFDPTPGLLTCCDYPAAVSGGVMNILCHMDALMVVFGRMLATDPDQKQDIVGAGPEWPLLVLAGTDDRDRYFGTALMDAVAMGSGARSYKDGVDTSGPAWSPLIRLLNIEASEQWYPIVYLYRREQTDSAGVGRWRGGVGMEEGITPYRAKSIEAITNTGGSGVSTHGGMGMFGGMPSPTARYLIARDTDVERRFGDRLVPDDIDDLDAGERVLLRAKSNGAPLGPGDVLETTFTGGGGYGDPLDREPERVARDVELGYVSREAAHDLHGVVVDGDGALDVAATERCRGALLADRATWKPAPGLTDERPDDVRTPATGEADRSVHEYLTACDRDGRRVLACSRCGEMISDYRGNYKHGLLAIEGPITVIPLVVDPAYFLDDEVVLRRFCCPGCHVQMATELVKADEPLLSEFRFA
ncbi:MAG: hydantoinase B/oxoprolinase family protein [Solirubrobacteraceae bacterium]